MASISASTSIDVPAPVERVLAAVADYARVRPQILPDQYRDYQVVEGGEGDGTVVTWDFQANPSLVHPIRAAVSRAGERTSARPRVSPAGSS